MPTALYSTLDDLQSVVDDIDRLADVDPQADRAVEAMDFVDQYNGLDYIEKQYEMLTQQARLYEEIYAQLEPRVNLPPGQAEYDRAIANAVRKILFVIKKLARRNRRQMRLILAEQQGIPPVMIDGVSKTYNTLTENAVDLRWRARNQSNPRPLVAGFLKNLKNKIKKSAVGKAVTKVKNTVKNSKAIQSIKTATSIIKKVATAPAKKIVQTVKKVTKAPVNLIRKGATQVVKTTKGVVNAVSKAIPAPIKNIVKKVPIVAAATGLVNAVSSTVKDTVKNIKEKGVIQGIKQTVTDKAKSTVESAKKAVGTVTSGIKTAAKKVGGAALTGYEKWYDTVGKIPFAGAVGKFVVNDFIGIATPEEFRENPAAAWAKTAGGVLSTAAMFALPGAGLLAKTGLAVGTAAASTYMDSRTRSKFEEGIINGTATRPDCSKGGAGKSFLKGLSGGLVKDCFEQRKLYDEAKANVEAYGAAEPVAEDEQGVSEEQYYEETPQLSTNRYAYSSSSSSSGGGGGGGGGYSYAPQSYEYEDYYEEPQYVEEPQYAEEPQYEEQSYSQEQVAQQNPNSEQNGYGYAPDTTQSSTSTGTSTGQTRALNPIRIPSSFGQSQTTAYNPFETQSTGSTGGSKLSQQAQPGTDFFSGWQGY